jgi:hypothetical protein
VRLLLLLLLLLLLTARALLQAAAAAGSWVNKSRRHTQHSTNRSMMHTVMIRLRPREHVVCCYAGTCK